VNESRSLRIEIRKEIIKQLNISLQINC